MGYHLHHAVKFDAQDQAIVGDVEAQNMTHSGHSHNTRYPKTIQSLTDHR